MKRAKELKIVVIGELGETPYLWAIEHGIKTLIHTTRYMRPLASESVQKQIAADPFAQWSKDFSSALFKTFGDDKPIPSEVTKPKEYAEKKWRKKRQDIWNIISLRKLYRNRSPSLLILSHSISL